MLPPLARGSRKISLNQLKSLADRAVDVIQMRTHLHQISGSPRTGLSSARAITNARDDEVHPLAFAVPTCERDVTAVYPDMAKGSPPGDADLGRAMPALGSAGESGTTLVAGGSSLVGRSVSTIDAASTTNHDAGPARRTPTAGAVALASGATP
jgi:hypothetical protein